MSREEKLALAKEMDNEELLRHLMLYAEYSNSFKTENKDDHETYRIIYDEILSRMK